MKRPRVGWIGLGIMGAPMARHLLRAGFSVTAYNRGASRREAFAADGGRVAESPRDVARASDVVFTMVSDTPDVESVVFGEKGVTEGALSGTMVIDMSTISPRATQTMAGRLSERGIRHLDAPVSGGESGAIAATLSIMVGGTPQAFADAEPLFAVLGKRITHVGPSGAGQSTKLVNQVAGLVTLAAVCESLALARASGLEEGRVLDAVGAGASASWQLSNLGPKMLAGDFRPGFPVRLARKDLFLVLEAADGLGLDLPVIALVERLFRELSRMGCDEDGTQALFRVLSKR